MRRTPTSWDSVHSAAKASGSLQGIELNARYSIDSVVDDSLVVEVKAVYPSNPIHQAQLLTYLRFGGYQIGLLRNFNRPNL